MKNNPQKKFALLLLLMVSICCHLAAQVSFSSIAPSPVSPSYSGTMLITGVNTNFTQSTQGLSLHLQHQNTGQLYEFGNTVLFQGGWCTNQTATTASGTVTLPANAPLGLYNVRIKGFGYYGNNFDYTENGLLTVLGNGAYFTGRVIFDLDSSCTFNAGDFGIENHIVTANPGGYVGLTDANGDYTMILPTGTYTFSTAAPNGTVLLCPSSPFTQNATMTVPGGSASGIDFYGKTDNYADAVARLFISTHRPGFTVHNTFRAQNASLTATNNTVAKLAKPSAFSFVSFTIPPTTINGDTAIWNLGTLAPLSYQDLGFDVSVPGVTLIGTPYNYHGEVTTSSAQLQLANDVDVISNLVSGSFDPNDKQVWNAAGQIADPFIDPADLELQYMIRFQNTGNDTAFNVHIDDDLDPFLIPTTFKLQGASHNCQVQFLDSLGRHLRFLFPNILLPDSNRNEPGSHGYVRYSVERMPGLSLGSTVSNTADIYFDFNTAVVTNTVNSTICPNLGTAFQANPSGLQVSFTAPNLGNPSAYAWDFGDGQTSTLANPIHTYAANGVYAVCLQLSNSCGRQATLCNTLYLGVTGVANPHQGFLKIALTPNPVLSQGGAELVHLAVEARGLSQVQFAVTDLQGKRIMGWEASSINGSYSKDLSVSALAPGLYFVHIQSGNLRHTIKLMVE